MTIQEELKVAQLLTAGKYADAVLLLEPLADQNSAYALLNLGWLYDSGNIGNRDTNLAKYYYQKAVKVDKVAGTFELARLLYDEGDMIEARQLFKDGEQYGSIQCEAWLGYMLARGEGGEKNTELAIKVLSNASKKGQLFARRQLYTIQIEKSNSVIFHLWVYMKIAWYLPIAGYLAWKNPFSERGYR